MDLEWNNTYAKRLGGFINEVIEIGAVKLDENLKQIDMFSCFINPEIGKKLHSRVKRLTNITNDDVITGMPFKKVFEKFAEWVDVENSVILTWADSDIRVLIENYKYFEDVSHIPFLGRYMDLQRYCQNFLKVDKSNQISLGNAAILLKIDVENYELHRALGDSTLSAECFRKSFQKDKLEEHIKNCDEKFYEWLSFKPHAIIDIDDPLVDKREMVCYCDQCGEMAEQINAWKMSSHSFRALFYCKRCDRKLRFSISFKKYFDRVEVHKFVRPFVEKVKEEKEEEQIKN